MGFFSRGSFSFFLTGALVAAFFAVIPTVLAGTFFGSAFFVVFPAVLAGTFFGSAFFAVFPVVLTGTFFGSAFFAVFPVVLAGTFFGSAFFAVFFSAILTTQVDDRLLNAYGHDIVEDGLEPDLPRQDCHVGLHDLVPDIQQLDDLAHV